MFFRLFLTVVLILGLVGCATTKKSESVATQSSDLQAKISDLEKQLEEKDSEIKDLQEKLSKVSPQEAEPVVNAQEVDLSKATSKQIQTALKNAGFYAGTIDGKIGRKTKEAIKEFQKTNGLKADGKVGKQTWVKLEKYL
jgi:peptidoglycan hydrolase-like protein with peptidoglycan-binding domain